MTNKASYSSTSNLAIQTPIQTHLQDPVTSRKDKQVYHPSTLPPSPTNSSHSTRDQHTAINALDHGKAQRQRSPTLDQSQNIMHHSNSAWGIDGMREVPTYVIEDASQNMKQSDWQQGESRSVNGDPTVLPVTAVIPSPSPLSASSGLSSYSHEPQQIDTPQSIFQRQHHFFRPPSVSSSMPRSMNNDTRTAEKSNAYARSDHDSQPRLLARHSTITPALPDFEVEAFCPSCQKWVMTRIRYRSGAGVWLFSFVL